MSEQAGVAEKGKRRWVGYTARALGILLLTCIGAVSIAQRLSDGPLNDMLPGDPTHTGGLAPQSELASAVAAQGACADGGCPPFDPIELELSGPGTSRYVGIMVRGGQVYLPCDLGFMWGRFEGTQRGVLPLIYLFEHWHEDALENGRVVVRVGGKR